ncbi:MAG: RHS repeat-associated core domain-containing protein, partial [Polyangiaceae bacterium]|nr:RHS repeat-associated core domain-containing protein [Polyangiaceae bacterium]
TYGANGELKTKTDGTDTTTYTYDALNNLRQVVLPNADTIEYLVDGLGRRVGKKKNGTLVKRWLFKDQLEPIAEIDEPSGNVRRFIYASRAHAPDLMIDHNGVAYRLLTDQLGSVRLVVRVSDGEVVQHIDYDPWGVPTVVTGGWGIQSFGFAGGVYDAETALVRFGARDYDARVGRWTGKDPVRWSGQDANLYRYVEDDPVNWFDPLGWLKLPADPSQLPPEWSEDPSHKHPFGKRFRHPSGDVLDWHDAQPGAPGWRGRDHWHHNQGKKHLPPGTDVADPQMVCRDFAAGPPFAPDPFLPEPRDFFRGGIPIWPLPWWPFPLPWSLPHPGPVPVY